MEDAVKTSWKERQKEQLRNELINVALELFQEKGFESTSVDDIVARIGIAKGTFYIYFKSKAEMVQAVLENALNDLESCITKALADAPEDAPRALEIVVKAQLSFLETHPAVTSMLVSNSKLPVELADDFHARYDSATRLVYERLVRKGMLQGCYREVDAELAADVLDGLILKMLKRADESGIAAADVCEPVLEFFSRGINRS